MEREDRELGARAFAAQRWQAAFEHLSRCPSLEPAELERQGQAAYLIGKHERATASWTLAHSGFVERGETLRAARLGFWGSA